MVKLVTHVGACHDMTTVKSGPPTYMPTRHDKEQPNFAW